MTLREKLIVLRDRAGLSQMELADRLGVSRQAVSRWESGDTTPTMDKLKSLARIYGVSLDWLCSAIPQTGNPLKQQSPKPTETRTRPPRERKVRKNRKSGPSRSHWRSARSPSSVYGLQQEI